MSRNAIQRKQGGRYRERRDADVEECNTYGAGMLILRERGCRCRMLPDTMPVTQQLSVRLANQCERLVWKLFQDESAVGRTSNLL
jgi:hypothetical protein